MNREIKFRAWDNVDYMSTPFTLQDIQAKRIEWTEEVKIMQYTGLKDKNGVEIYEGDVVLQKGIEERGDGHYDDELYTVKYENGSFYCDEPNASYLEYLSELHADVEIVTNIYENPELLN